MFTGGTSGAGRPFMTLATAFAQILPIALAIVPDFGTGRPVVASPTTWTVRCLSDS